MLNDLLNISVKCCLVEMVPGILAEIYNVPLGIESIKFVIKYRHKNINKHDMQLKNRFLKLKPYSFQDSFLDAELNNRFDEWFDSSIRINTLIRKCFRSSERRPMHIMFFYS